MKISVVDYGAGNLRSVAKALDFIGVDSVCTDNICDIRNNYAIILPGVGAFPEAKRKLTEKNLFESIRKEVFDGKPFLGICLGMQLMFEKSSEFEVTDGFGFIPGTIEKISPFSDGKQLKIPHIGWNSISKNKTSPLFYNIGNGEYFYFVHSFAAKTCDRFVSAYTDYGGKIVASVENKTAFGTQFHPEKSGDLGIKILKNFIEMVQHDNFSSN